MAPQTAKGFLAGHALRVRAATGRVADLSPGLAAARGLDTDDFVRITIAAEYAIPVGKKGKRAGHGSGNPDPKPPIKAFIESPNHSARNVSGIDKVVLHCTEAPLESTLAEFQKAQGRQVSAHYVIDRNGDIYQMVRDSERANHCMGANESSIGIEHVGGENDALAPAQARTSAALIRWLLQQYDIPRTNVYGHDFTPGYSRPGGMSCPDKLFGAAHNQGMIAASVEANIRDGFFRDRPSTLISLPELLARPLVSSGKSSILLQAQSPRR